MAPLSSQNTSSSDRPDWLETIRSSFLNGLPIIISDDTDQNGSSALIFPADLATAPLINRCLHLSGGASAQVALSPKRSENLQLEPMGFNRSTELQPPTAATRELISVEARSGVTTGISAADRATTIRLLGGKNANSRELVKPGHIFPTKTREGGVLVRSAIPEAAVDIVQMCQQPDAAAYFELFASDGSYLSENHARELAQKESLTFITIGQLVTARLQSESVIERVSEVKLPTQYQSDMKAILYRSPFYQGEHLAIIKGEISSDSPVVTRVHPERTFQDVFGGAKSSSLQDALALLAKQESGVLVYLRRPDKHPLLQELKGQMAAPISSGAQMKEYGLGAQILRDLGVKQIKLLSSSGAPASGLANFGLEIVEQKSLQDARG